MLMGNRDHEDASVVKAVAETIMHLLLSQVNDTREAALNRLLAELRANLEAPVPRASAQHTLGMWKSGKIRVETALP